MQQHGLYAATLGLLGTPSVRLAWRTGGLERARARGRTLGLAHVICRPWPLIGRTAYLARGPVWAEEVEPALRRAALHALLAQLRSAHRAVLVTPDPIGGADPLDGAGWLPMVTPATYATLDLSPDTATQRARLKQKWRNRLARADAGDLQVTVGPMPDAPHHWLLRAEAAQARARRYRRLPDAFTLAWVRAGGPDATLLLTATCPGESDPVAAMLFLRHGAGASYHIGWSGAAGRARNAHTLLMWRAMRCIADDGARLLNLDALDTEGAPGLARFKLGTGARAVTLGATRLAAPGTPVFAPRRRDRRRVDRPAPHP